MYYGISFGSTSLLGDAYLNFTLSQFVQLPGIAIAFFTFDRVGRKWSLITLQAAAGACCVTIGLLDTYTPTTEPLASTLSAFQSGENKMCYVNQK